MTRHLVLSGGLAHDFDGTSRALVDLLALDDFDSVVVTDPDEALAMLRAAEGRGAPPIDLVTVNALRWRMEADRYAAWRAEQAYVLTGDDAALLERYVDGGGGLLVLHTAVICFDADPVWHRLCGASWNWASSSHPPVGPADVRVTGLGRCHPLTEGLDDFTITDEVYGFLEEEDDLDPLLSSAHGGRDHPLLWAREIGSGRVVTDLLGHGVASLSHPAHRTVLARAGTWAARRIP
jgi:hypothetical protein